MLEYFKKKYKLNMKINYDFVDIIKSWGKQICEHISFHIF